MRWALIRISQGCSSIPVYNRAGLEQYLGLGLAQGLLLEQGVAMELALVRVQGKFLQRLPAYDRKTMNLTA